MQCVIISRAHVGIICVLPVRQTGTWDPLLQCLYLDKCLLKTKKHCICLCQIQGNCCCSVTQSCPTLCDPLDRSMPGFPVLHHLQELAETHVYRAGDAVQPSHPQLSPSPPAFNLQGLLQWVGSVSGGQSIGASAQRNCKGLKITACMLSWHKSWATRYRKTKKIQLPLLKSQEAKAHAPLHTWPPKGWADHLRHPPTQPLGPRLCKEPVLPPPRAVSWGTCYLFLLPHTTAEAPVKPCLNFLSGLSQFLLIKEGQETWPVPPC